MWTTTWDMLGITALGLFLLSNGLDAKKRAGGQWDGYEGMEPFSLVRSGRDLGLAGRDQTLQDGAANKSKNPTIPANPNPSASSKYFELELPPDYSKHAIPKHSSGRPMEIFIQLKIRKVLSLDESGESIKIDLEFRALWTDYKIRDFYNSKLVAKGLRKMSYDELTPETRKNMTETLNDPNMLEAIWKPNLFFGNLLKVTQPFAVSQPVTLKLIPQIAAFEYLTRLSVVTDCGMDFYYYPADTQSCRFSIRPFSYTQNQVKLSWYRRGVWLQELQTSNFDIKVEQLRKYSKIVDDEDPLSDYFEVFEFLIKSRRRLSYHLLQTYLPSTFYIIITCICFLLPPRYVEARIGIAMTTLLTLTAMFASVRDSTPIVSYVKAIDTWMAGCILFVFLTLAEFTFMTWLKSIQEDFAPIAAKKTDVEMGELGKEPLDTRKKELTSTTIRYMNPVTLKRFETLNITLEKFNFPIFLGILTIYSLAYWIWLLKCAEYFDWEVDKMHNNVMGLPW